MGLMETRDPGYRVNRCRERVHLSSQADILLPDLFNLAPGPATLPISFKHSLYNLILGRAMEILKFLEIATL